LTAESTTPALLRWRCNVTGTPMQHNRCWCYTGKADGYKGSSSRADVWRTWEMKEFPMFAVKPYADCMAERGNEAFSVEEMGQCRLQYNAQFTDVDIARYYYMILLDIHCNNRIMRAWFQCGEMSQKSVESYFVKCISGNSCCSGPLQS
jgi:hypothetical protein